MRRHGGREEMRRPRAGFASLPPGGPGQPSAPTTWRRLNWLDAARTKAGESLPDRGPGSGPVRARKLRPRDRKAAMERREAPAFLARGARLDGRLVRHSVLHPLAFRRGEKKGRRRTRRRKEYG